jgi:site-specific recombinase XerD
LGFEESLVAGGFSDSGVNHRLYQFAHLSRWAGSEGLAADELTPDNMERFVVARRAAGYASWISFASTRLPLEYLRDAGIVAAVATPNEEDALERLLGDFRCYLLRERVITQHTAARYVRLARLFLRDHDCEHGLEQLSTADVSLFLARECPKRTVAACGHLLDALRALLRYLYVTGLVDVPLRLAVPRMADHRDRSLPRGLEPATVARLLTSCDRRTTIGRRDYAVLLLLVRLGLRAAEAAKIELDDVDWRHGELLVRGKGSRHEQMPLPNDVGEALVSYLCRRYPSENREVFLNTRAPRAPISPRRVSTIVRGACLRAGLPPMGAHRLRHTAASQMLRAGASLPEIAQVLRHRQLKTTARYAKVDRTALRELALPWPGSTS